MKFQFTLLLSFLMLGSFAQNKISYLKMQRTACFGKCPEYTVELFKNGDILYVGKKNVDIIGNFKAHIKPEIMSSFFKKIGKYKLNSALNVYKPKAVDVPHLNFTFILNGKTKGIKNADAGPAYLASIGKQTDSLLSTFEWTEQPMDEEVGGNPVLDIQVKNDQSAYVINDKEAEYPGGAMAMMEFIRKNIKYPSQAKDAGVEGKVICNFTIGKDGKVTDVKIMRGIGYGCDDEAMRVIRMMPKWKPAMQQGKAVDTHMNIPVDFKLK